LLPGHLTFTQRIGRYCDERRVQNQGYFRTERHYGRFRRTVPLPVAVNTDQAGARFEHGVLEVRAPKRSPLQGPHGRRLQIQHAH